MSAVNFSCNLIFVNILLFVFPYTFHFIALSEQA